MIDKETIERLQAERSKLYDEYDFEGVARLDLQIDNLEKADRCIKSKTNEENIRLENNFKNRLIADYV